MRTRTSRLSTVLVGVAAASVALAGCTSSSDADTSDSEESSSSWVGAGKDASELTFATNVKSMAFDWFVRMAEGVDEFGADTGVTVYTQGPSQADAAQQVQLAQDQIAQGIDALVAVPIDVASMEPVFEQALDEGIVVITHEAATVENAVWDVEAFSDVAYGEHLMQELATRMDETGQYAVFVGSLDSAAQNIWMDAAIEYQEENYPDMELVGDRQATGSDQSTAYSQMNQLMQTYPEIGGMIGGDAYDVVGAGQAIEEAGLSDDIVAIGTSIKAYAEDLIRSGAVDFISSWDPAITGYAANQVALMVIEGEEISEGMDLGVPGFESIVIDGKVIMGSAWNDVTLENIDSVEF